MYNEDEVEAEVTKMLRDLEDKSRRLNQMSDREFDALPKFFDDAEEYIFEVIDSYDKSGRKMAGAQYEVVLAELGRLQDAYNEALYRRSLYGYPEEVREMYPEKRPVLMSPMRGEQSFSSSYTKQPKMSEKAYAAAGLHITTRKHTKKNGEVVTRQTFYLADGNGHGELLSRGNAESYINSERGPVYRKTGKPSAYGQVKDRTIYVDGRRMKTDDLGRIEAYSRARETKKNPTIIPKGELKAVAYRHGVSPHVVTSIVRDMDHLAYAELDAYTSAGKRGYRGLRFSEYEPTRKSSSRSYRSQSDIYQGVFPVRSSSSSSSSGRAPL